MMTAANLPFDESALSHCPVVSSSINYLGKMNELPVFYAEKHHLDNLVLEPHTVRIHDARKLTDEPELEINGFQLVGHETKVRDFEDKEHSEEVYRPEIEELVLELTGADKVIVGNTVLRWSEKAGDMTGFVNTRPARFVHVDYSRQSFNEFARDHLADAADAEEWLQRRDPPGMPEIRFGSSLYHASPTHRWFFFSDMRLGEALVFKAFDTDPERVQGCPHSAFNDPNCPGDAPPRASAEIRAYAFF
jgi:hypothetical protein